MTFEHEQPKIEEENAALENFRQEIQYLKDEEGKEMKRKEAEGATGSIHLQELNPRKLAPEDMTIYEKFKKTELDKKEFGDWRQKINEELEKGGPSKSEDRYIFAQYIANKIGFWEKWEAKKEALKSFREEFARIKEEERRKMEKGENVNPHLFGINSKHLTVKDKEIFDKFERGEIKDSDEEFRTYRSEVFKDCQKRFQQEVARHKKLKEILERPTPEGEKPLGPEPFLRFSEIFSRSNFLAWMANEFVKAKWEERRKKKQNPA